MVAIPEVGGPRSSIRTPRGLNARRVAGSGWTAGAHRLPDTVLLPRLHATCPPSRQRCEPRGTASSSHSFDRVTSTCASSTAKTLTAQRVQIIGRKCGLPGRSTFWQAPQRAAAELTLAHRFETRGRPGEIACRTKRPRPPNNDRMHADRPRAREHIALDARLSDWCRRSAPFA